MLLLNHVEEWSLVITPIKLYKQTSRDGSVLNINQSLHAVQLSFHIPIHTELTAPLDEDKIVSSISPSYYIYSKGK
ncbi:hypothetical protein C0J52_25682 [Blattella germanica]|nr:hypothetical protein C0J52_25682 [Blattella germanica]